MGANFAYLLKDRRFLPFFLTQFFGAFNDNAFKLSMLTLISYHLSQTQAQSEYYQAMAGALFILPFFLFSATSGQLADKYDKAMLTRLIKVFELILMIVGGIGLFAGNIMLMMIILTGMGLHSTFFGPIKYAILPDHLPREELLGATGLVEASTFIAILLGTTLGTLLIGISSTPYLAIFLTLFAAFSGLVASLFIPSAPSSLFDLRVDLQVFRATYRMLSLARENSRLFLSIMIISWFWLIGAVLLTKLPDYTHYILGANTVVFAIFLALFSIGIALGSLMINRILKGRITLALVPLAMILFSFFTFDLYWATPQVEVKEPLINFITFFTYIQHWRIAFDLFMLSFSTGLFVVPVYTYLQVGSDPQARARVIAANNIYNAMFMVLGTVFVMGLLRLHVAIPQVFMILSILNFIVAIGIWWLMKRIGAE